MAGDGQDLTDNARLPPSSTSLNLFVCCTCLLDTFQPCLSPFALSIPKSLSLPTSPLPFLLPRLDCWGPYAKVRDIFLIDGTEIKYKKAPPYPCLSSLIYLFKKSVRPSPESHLPLLSHVSLLRLLRLPVKCQRSQFPSRKATLELTAFSNVGLLFTI